MHPYMYMGRNVPKEGKNREKVTFYFVDTQKLIYQPYKVTQSSLLVRTRMCARFPTAMLIFCCHKCHTWRENGEFYGEKNKVNQRKNRGNRPKCRPEKRTFPSPFH